MVFVFDEGFSPKLVNGLRILEAGNFSSQYGIVELWHIKELGQSLEIPILEGQRSYTDEQVIQIAGLKKGIILTQDKDFKQLKKKAKVFEEHGVAAFYFQQGKKTFRSYWSIVVYLTTRWEEIKENVHAREPPYYCCFTPKGLQFA